MRMPLIGRCCKVTFQNFDNVCKHIRMGKQHHFSTTAGKIVAHATYYRHLNSDNKKRKIDSQGLLLMYQVFNCLENEEENVPELNTDEIIESSVYNDFNSDEDSFYECSDFSVTDSDCTTNTDKYESDEKKRINDELDDEDEDIYHHADPHSFKAE